MSLLGGILQAGSQPNNPNPQNSPPRIRRSGLELQLGAHPIRRQSQQRRQSNVQRPQVQIVKNQLGQRLNRIYKFPASLNEAKVHAKASMNGYKTPISRHGQGLDTIPTQMCPCCQNFINTIEIPLTYSTYPKKVTKQQISNKIFQIQAGDALFFCFIKLLITYLCIRFFIYDAYNIYTNLLGTYCQQPLQVASPTNCLSPFVDFTATPNKATSFNQSSFFVLDILNIIFTLVSVVFFFYGRVKLKQLYQLLEGWDVTEDDYTLLIEDIPLIPFDANDDRLQDVTGEYKQFLIDHIEMKVRSWLNSFYSYDNQDQIEAPLDRQFFQYVYRDKKNNEEEGQLYDEIVSSINLCYDLTQLQNLQVLRKQLVEDFIVSEGKKQVQAQNLFDEEDDQEGDQGQKYVSFLPHQIQIINRHYIKVCQRIAQSTQGSQMNIDEDSLPVEQLKISRFVGKAFVSLKHQHYKDYILDRYERDNQFLKVNGNKVPLKVSGATKPYDIKWINMKISDQYRAEQLRNSYLLVTISIIVAGTILFFLSELKAQYYAASTKKSSAFQSIFVLSLPIWTYIVNYVLAWGLYQLNAYERHKTKTQELTSRITKNIASKFLNTAFIYALIYYFGPKINFLNANGLVYTIVSLVVVNAALNIALQATQPFEYYRQWKNKKVFDSIDKDGKIGLFQIQLNQLVERPAYSYDFSYSYYLQMAYIVAFYGFLTPIITPLTIIAFAFQYWVDKYNLFKRFSSPVDLGYSLTDLIWKALELTLLLHSLGHILWIHSLNKHPSQLNFISGLFTLGVSVIYMIWVLFFSKSMQTFVDRFENKNKIHVGTYQQEHKKFSKTYNTLNPATAFAERQKTLEEDIIARFTDYSILQQHRIEYRKRFVPQNEAVLKDIWESKQNQTTIQLIKQGIQFDFRTLFCC